ncbi:hypothetical protein J1N35_037193 [Gossypium stocksii]|uniref:Uncharacterized protein n=1 Tax=Gossypium stocksii TaxID=47602 RepID=A0A9D3ULJ3_9ROSI|nr:hypothetical protein J1N35_037193 [Gossypium stocksii]
MALQFNLSIDGVVVMGAVHVGDLKVASTTNRPKRSRATQLGISSLGYIVPRDLSDN